MSPCGEGNGASRAKRLAVHLLTVMLLAVPIGVMAQERRPACPVLIGRVVSIQGVVEIRRSGAPDWVRVARLNTPMCDGDLLRAGARSRAGVILAPETLIRVDQGTVLSVRSVRQETEAELFLTDQIPNEVLGNVCGASYFITRFPRKFRVKTPYLSAVVEGTEFQMALACDRAELSVFEGRVAAESVVAQSSRIVLESGQTTSAGPGEPPTAIRAILRPTDAVQWALFYPPTSEVDVDQLPADCSALERTERAACLIARTEALLKVGRVEEAQVLIKSLTEVAPLSPEASALSSIIALVKNDKTEALQLAQRGVELSDKSSRAWLALSYAQQAHFDLEKALESMRRAATLEPGSALIQARVSELLMSQGETREAEKAALQAVKINPRESRAHTVLGFVYLASVDTARAKSALEQAIELDSADPLPRLGNGLALIREGQLERGREEIEIAVVLDPGNSLLRSYAGKAYYEENTEQRDHLAATQFDLAEYLDPQDPTPHYYQAILNQSLNKHTAALNDLREARSKNDNRAVFRSKLLLDKDDASRSADIGRIYNGLGAGQLARVEATFALDDDPLDPSSHRLLADSYVHEPRHEIARASELLQAQMRQPPGEDALQPLFAFDTRSLLVDLSDAAVGIGEYSSLFTRHGPTVRFGGLRGTQRTRGHNFEFNQFMGPASVSVAHFQYDTQGYRENNDDQRSSIDFLLNVRLRGGTYMQVAFNTFEASFGDLASRLVGAPLTERTTRNTDTTRLGIRHELSPRSNILVSLIDQDRIDQVDTDLGHITTHDKSQWTETQYAFRGDWLSILAGVGYFEGNTDELVSFFSPDPVASRPFHFNAYTYLYSKLDALRLSGQLGVSHDRLRSSDTGDRRNTNPKIGLLWQPLRGTVVRGAFTETLKRQINADQGLEPTQVAGFNQLFDDNNGAISRRRSFGFDQEITGNVHLGGSISDRRVDSMAVGFAGLEPRRLNENSSEAYIHAFPASWVAFNGRLRRESFDALYNYGIFSLTDPYYLRTLRAPMTTKFFFGQRYAVSLSAEYVNQLGFYAPEPAMETHAKSIFWLGNASISYALPRRRGAISASVLNVFDKEFRFEDLSILQNQSPIVKLAPSRTFFLSASISLF